MNHNTQIRPLCLSFWSPPTVRPQAILIGKMIPEWIRQGVPPVIMTYRSNGDWDVDAPVHKIPRFQMGRIAGRIPALRWWYRRAYQRRIVAEAIALIREHNLNVIFSFANPQDSNSIGAMIHKQTGIPFVSHFSDPWYDNPCATMSSLRKRRVRQQEQEVIDASAAVIFINGQLRDMVMRKYSDEDRRKSHVIEHCFDRKLYPAESSSMVQEHMDPKGRYVISYIGAFYAQRNPETLFKAVQLLLKRRPELSGSFVLQFVGVDSGYTDFGLSKLRDMMQAYAMEPHVVIQPQTDYIGSLAYMKASHLLVLIDVINDESYCLPSKIVDYAGSSTPIVGIANADSPVAAFLQQLGYTTVTHDNAVQLSEYLETCIQNQAVHIPNTAFLERYNVVQTTKQLLEIFHRVR